MAVNTPDEYIDTLPADRREAISALRDTINAHLPEGFRETISYGMIGWVVPHERYPKGYHCSPELPLPFLNIASQKQHIAFYHMGLYADPALYDWFLQAWPEHSERKPDMGKSCIRFKRPEHIPYALLGELCTRMSVDGWITLYESQLRPDRK
jgi:hypothetical protein